MELIPTPESSNIEKFGYEPVSKTLFVQFKNQNYYAYTEVPEDIFSEMKTAESKGRFYNRHVKGIFMSTRI